jgi:peptidase M15-like protein
MQFSEHFQSAEFEKPDAIPAECLDIFALLCTEILEPVRTFVGKPITITSGYRSPEHNAEIHGSATSEHVASPTWCAADFTFDTTFGLMMSVRRVFDWIRNSPSLPFHQCILEHCANGSSIVHVSVNTGKTGEREALEGSTYNASPYTSWEVVAYNPPTGQESENAGT